MAGVGSVFLIIIYLYGHASVLKFSTRLKMFGEMNSGGKLLIRTLSFPLITVFRERFKGVISRRRQYRLYPSKTIMKKIENKRRFPGLGIYAGQISNFDVNEINYFPLTIPNIPLTPQGTDYKPSKLFAVWRTGRLSGQAYWLKDIMENKLGLSEEISVNQPAILRNSPAVNQMLWHVKHLVRIRPITFPDGFPTENDLGSTLLTHDGQLKIRKEYKYTQDQLAFEEEEKKMDTVTLRKVLRKRWLDPWDI